MGERFKDIYRIPSARLQNWDYGWNAAYFVTICTSHRECYVGDILTTHTVETPESGVSTQSAIKMQLSENGKIVEQFWNEIPHPGTLGVIINQYKRICTIIARKIHAGFDWQTRFHDHIIRDDESFRRISEYIQNNPLNWHTDKFHNESGQT